MIALPENNEIAHSFEFSDSNCRKNGDAGLNHRLVWQGCLFAESKTEALLEIIQKDLRFW